MVLKFHFGETTLKDESRAGCVLDFDAIILNQYWNKIHVSQQEVSERLNISQSNINRHLQKLRKFSKLRIWVPQNFSERNKDDCMSILPSLLSLVKIEPF